MSGIECRDGESSVLSIVCNCRPAVALDTVDESATEHSVSKVGRFD